MDELTELEKEIFDAMIGRPFGSSKVYDNPQIIRQAKAAASLCREKCKEAIKLARELKSNYPTSTHILPVYTEQEILDTLNKKP